MPAIADKTMVILKAHPFIAGGAALVVLGLLIWLGAGARNSWERHRLNSKIESLEREKSAAESRAATAERRVLELQGQIELRTKDLEAKDAQLRQSAEKILAAETEVSRRASTYRQVRALGPQFRAGDVAGRVRELRADADELYPPDPHR